jgi:hypothetical protein
MIKLFVPLMALVVGFAAGAGTRPERSPHVAALELVFQKAPERIRQVDRLKWWFDTEERTWVVQRPFAPGGIDSTHLFDVRYRVAGKQVAAWQVDTRKGTVTEVPAAKAAKK